MKRLFWVLPCLFACIFGAFYGAAIWDKWYGAAICLCFIITAFVPLCMYFAIWASKAELDYY